MMREPESVSKNAGDLSISFGCQFTSYQMSFDDSGSSSEDEFPSKGKCSGGSFSGLSGAAISANFTLANTNIGNGLIGEEILPVIDSPNAFKKLKTSSSFSSISRLDVVSTSPNSPILDIGKHSWELTSPLSRVNSFDFLSTMDVQMAGGAAGEDRVQAVCSEKDGWLICGIYDGFNGRDAADFLAGTLYDNIMFYLYLWEWKTKQHNSSSVQHDIVDHNLDSGMKSKLTLSLRSDVDDESLSSKFLESEYDEVFRSGVVDCLKLAVQQAETDFLNMVENDMEGRPDLVCVGSCVLVVLLHKADLYILNLGDSRAVLARSTHDGNVPQAVQLTETHTVDNEFEYKKVLAEHPEDHTVVTNGKLKGKLKLTRAIGVGYLKKKEYNDAVMGLIKVRDLSSPPYVSTIPHTLSHKITEDDLFVVLGSDGLFDIFSNTEIVQLVYQYLLINPSGDPATYIIEKLLHRAAQNGGMSLEELIQVPVGMRRKYHDDITVIVIIIGSKQRIMTASTSR